MSSDEVVRAYQDQQKQFNSYLRSQALINETMQELLTSVPVKRRSNFYEVLTFSLTNAVNARLLFDSSQISGNFLMQALYIDNGGAGLSYLRLNTAQGGQIQVVTGLTIRDFDIKKVYYDVVTPAQDSTVRIEIEGWIK